MSDHKPNHSRRKFLKGTLAGAATLPLAGLAQRSWAQQKVQPDAPLAQSLNYTPDAASLPKSAARKPNEFCHNCQFFQAQAAKGDSTQWAPCTIFKGKLVSADGWCSSWVAASG